MKESVWGFMDSLSLFVLAICIYYICTGRGQREASIGLFAYLVVQFAIGMYGKLIHPSCHSESKPEAPVERWVLELRCEDRIVERCDFTSQDVNFSFMENRILPFVRKVAALKRG